VTERGLQRLVERHVELFNAAVSSGNYGPFLATFAEDAVMRFDDFPIGPFVGRSAIAEAYATQPPSDTMALIGMQVLGADAVIAAFEWDAGGTGHIYLRFRGRQVAELAIELGQVPEPRPGEATPSGP
jgi:steroid delta-isomerase